MLPDRELQRIATNSQQAIFPADFVISSLRNHACRAGPRSPRARVRRARSSRHATPAYQLHAVPRRPLPRWVRSRYAPISGRHACLCVRPDMIAYSLVWCAYCALWRPPLRDTLSHRGGRISWVLLPFPPRVGLMRSLCSLLLHRRFGLWCEQLAFVHRGRRLVLQRASPSG